MTFFRVARNAVSIEKTLLAALCATLACVALFALWPNLDLAVARKFFDAGHFIGRTRTGEILRSVFYDAPYVILGCCCLPMAPAASARHDEGRTAARFSSCSPLWRSGPGLLVNGVLKENSHRPRPEQTVEFGGPWRSGHMTNSTASAAAIAPSFRARSPTSAWTLAPALAGAAAPPRAGGCRGAGLHRGDGALRMSFGGHYLSDALLAALFTFLIVLGFYRWYLRSPETMNAGGHGALFPSVG